MRIDVEAAYKEEVKIEEDYFRLLKVGDKITIVDNGSIRPIELKITMISKEIEDGGLERNKRIDIRTEDGRELTIRFINGYMLQEFSFIIYKDLRHYLKKHDIIMNRKREFVEELSEQIKEYQKIKDKIKEERPELIV